MYTFRYVLFCPHDGIFENGNGLMYCFGKLSTPQPPLILLPFQEVAQIMGLAPQVLEIVCAGNLGYLVGLSSFVHLDA